MLEIFFNISSLSMKKITNPNNIYYNIDILI